MTGRAVPGIFCVEGPWSANLKDEKSVLPLLNFMRGLNRVRFIHQTARTTDAVVDLLHKWSQQQYRTYAVGYLGFHGYTGTLVLGRRHVSLETLAELIPQALRGKIVYFGSCSVLKAEPARVDEFRRITGAKGVIGFTKDVDWYPSAAFDLLLLEALTSYQRLDAVDRYLHKSYPGLTQSLGFTMSYGHKQRKV